MDEFQDYLYKHQKEAIECQNRHSKCLINMWCGTGKTRTFTMSLFIDNKPNNVIVFPSLGLINQYCNDYILNRDEPFHSQFAKYKCLAFCSDDESKLKIKTDKIQYTTNEKTLRSFLKKRGQNIIAVTYQSFKKFIDICIEKHINIDTLVFDEAHHIVGDNIQNIVFNNDMLDIIVNKTRFYTATPVNKNAVVMYDRNDDESSDCGPLAYEYLYYQAVEDKICKDFETHISLYRQKPEYSNKYQPIFESIIRACLSGKYNYWNVLTYHSYVNESDKTNDEVSFVKEFASLKNQTLVKKLFTRIQKDEFSHTTSIYSVDKIILKGVHSKTQNRQSIIADFDHKVEGRIYILSSCGILNEGIDTKWANMGVPINPSQSIVKESQRIGRLVRIPEPGMPPATILIPFMVDATKYSSMDTAESKNQMILNELSESGNFKTALNVISAFKYQYDPDLYEMCLKYPNMYAPPEIKDNLKSQGLIVEESKGSLVDNLKYVCEKEDITLDIKEYVCDKEGDILNDIAEQCDKTIEIHTQSYDDTVKYINEDAVDEEPLRLFYCEDDDSYSPITKKDITGVMKRKSTTPPKKRPKLFDINIHPDLEVLWKIKESSIDLNKAFSQGILDVDVKLNEKTWKESIEQVKEFIHKNKKRPTAGSKNQEEKILGRWTSGQVHQHKRKLFIMKESEIYDAWTVFINHPTYKEYFISNEENWFTNLEQVKQFIDKYRKRPTTWSKNQDEKILGNWVSKQQKNYKKKKEIMKDPEIYDAWTVFINHHVYKLIFFLKNQVIWFTNLDQVKQFIDKNKKRPTTGSKNQDEKILGNWISSQSQNYKQKKDIMKESEIYDAWTVFINHPTYKEYFISNEENWFTNLEQVKQFIDKYRKRPTTLSKNQDEKILGNWLSTQLINYKKKKNIMKEPEIYNAWTIFINHPTYNAYFISNEENWFQNLEQAKQFIDKHKKRPSHGSKNEDEKELGCWLGSQLQNYKKKAYIMKEPEIYDAWTVFINHPTYNAYFNSNEENWFKNLEQVKQFIDKNNKKPSTVSKNEDEKILRNWVSTQLKNYKKKKEIMKDPEIYDAWTEFINHTTYKEYFISNEEIWLQNLEQVKQFIDKHKKRPNKRSKAEKKLGCWLSSQLQNYKQKNDIMKEPEIYDAWTAFINNPIYKEYFISNEENWFTNLENLKQFIDKHKKRTADRRGNTQDEKELGCWLGSQLQNYKKKAYIMKEPEIYDAWTAFINNPIYKEYFISNEENWFTNLENLKQFIDKHKKRPADRRGNTQEDNKLGSWMQNQLTNYKNKIKIMKQQEIYNAWAKFRNDPNYSKYFQTTKLTKDMSKPEIKPKKSSQEIKQERHQRAKSEISVLHQKYKTMTSQNLNTYFKEDSSKWEEYHKISKDNEESFPEDEIPRNKMIRYLEKLPGKKDKVVADLGCGFAEINEHFKSDSRFIFYNFDHVSKNDLVVSRDIKNTELDEYSVDIAILSLAMWGSNCKDYISEAYRILDTGGTLLIAEAYKRWNKELDSEDKPINKLVKLLEENNFTIIKNVEQKFMFIECRKN